MKRIKTGVWVNDKYECSDQKSAEFNTYFDSKLELAVYMRLISRGFEVERQKPILIKPETNLFNARYWKIDFYLPDVDRYIEVKGEWILQDSIYKADFVKTLEMVEYCGTRIYEKIILVSQKAFKVGSFQFCTIDEMMKDLKFLRSKYQ